MIEAITAHLLANAIAYAGGSIVLALLTWALKKIPTAAIRKWLYEAAFKAGAAVSGFFCNWKFTKAIWNNTLEPWIIGFLDMIVGALSSGFFDGLRADNEKK